MLILLTLRDDYFKNNCIYIVYLMILTLSGGVLDMSNIICLNNKIGTGGSARLGVDRVKFWSSVRIRY